jgi:hypothetical protein
VPAVARPVASLDMALPDAILTHSIHKSRTVGAGAQADGKERGNPPEPHPRCIMIMSESPLTLLSVHKDSHETE